MDGDSLPESPITLSANDSDNESTTSESSDDDGVYQGDTEVLLDNANEAENGAFGDEEQDIVASDSYRWKIKHSRGDHRLKG
jgi:hypothetical protein